MCVNREEDYNWLCPPANLVPRVIGHAQNTNANGILVVPQWSSSSFWPLLIPYGVTPAKFAKECLELTRTETLLILPGQIGASFLKGLPNTLVLALELSSNQLLPWVQIKDK